MAMQKTISFFVFIFSFLLSNAQHPYWQQKVDFTIQVQLNDESHTLDGFAKMNYVNHSPDTLRYIWFHLWPNAYKNDKTAFSDQLLENDRTDFYFSESNDRGYINRLDFRVNELLVKTEDHPEHIDIIKLILPKPLLPQDSILITTPFHVQLPKNFSRGGHIGKSYQITQWYPKPAVYDSKGWHPMPYLDQGEFYAEFGDFKVDITLPQTYKVLSSGNLLNPEDDIFLKTLQPVRSPNTISLSTDPRPQVPLKTLRFEQNSIHDFAWFASPDYEIKKDSIVLPSGRVVILYAAFLPAQKNIWAGAMVDMKEALLQRNKWIGEYNYDILSVVHVPTKYNGGMEYPCITAISTTNSEKELQEVIAHEIGHNWFQGMIGNNERSYAWMDEGLNTYYDRRFKSVQHHKIDLLTESLTQMLSLTYKHLKIDQPVNTPSSYLSSTNYYLSSYYKPSQLFEYIENKMGRRAFDSAIQTYFDQWKFRHPQPEDLFAVLQSYTPYSLDTIISFFNKKGVFPFERKEKLRLGFLGAKTFAHSNTIMATPLPAYNRYDGFMIGGMFTNYQLPPKRFQFLLAPLYGTKSKSMNYVFRLGYTFFPKNIFSRIHFSLSGMKFNTDDFTSENNRKYITGFQKIVPSVKFILQNSDPRSKMERFIQWKSFWIEEGRLRFSSDGVEGGGRVLNIRQTSQNRWLHQLQFVWKNTRILYPYQLNAMAERSTDFTRLSFTGITYLNYNQKEGAKVRFFAGKFLYNGTVTSTKFFSTSPFHLNLTGPRGFEDYTYSNYFIGRNEFEGFASQQIMMRDGGFKVRTDLLADKIGKTDNWLMAMNFVSDIPERFNVLNALPVKIPLKLFLDIGTYADTWQEGYQGSKILYNAGLQIPLLNNIVQVYVPLLYSKVYRDYINSTITGNKLLNTISFSIDIQELTLKKLDKNLPY
jgi:hypothetical protein